MQRARSWSSTALVADPQTAADLLQHLVHDCRQELNPPRQYVTQTIVQAHIEPRRCGLEAAGQPLPAPVLGPASGQR